MAWQCAHSSQWRLSGAAPTTAQNCAISHSLQAPGHRRRRRRHDATPALSTAPSGWHQAQPWSVSAHADRPQMRVHAQPSFEAPQQVAQEPQLSALSSSLQLAWSRATHTLSRVGLDTAAGSEQSPGHDVPLVLDPYAQGLLALGPQDEYICDPTTQLSNLLTTRYIDDTLLAAMEATNVNTIANGDYRQVVLVGDGLDTRPFRLPWPEGTLIFLVAPKSVHESVVPLLKEAGARVPRGCLLRRVYFDPATDEQGVLGTRLEAAGYQASRLSVWAIQGLFSQGLSVDSVRSLLLDVTASAAFHSLILGEFPAPTTRKDVENELAQFGLLCTVLGMSDDAVSQGHWQPATHTNGTQGVQSQPQSDSISHSDSVGSQSDLRWIFTGQQMRLSLAQEGLYEDHVSAQVDEDFFGNFS